MKRSIMLQTREGIPIQLDSNQRFNLCITYQIQIQMDLRYVQYFQEATKVIQIEIPKYKSQ